MQSLIDQQLTHRQKLQQQLQPIIEGHKQKVHDVRQEIARYMEMGGTPPSTPKDEVAERQNARNIDYMPEL